MAIKLAYQESIDAETLLALRMLLSLQFYAAIGLHSLRDRLQTGRGLPTGAEVEYADGQTLSRAMESRREME